jgi:hypothetical protein
MFINGSSLPKHLRLLVACGIAVGASGCGGDSSPAPPVATGPSVQELTATCASLKGQVIDGVTITDTKRIAAAASVNPAGLCQVLATRAPYLDIEVDVPDNWSGRLLQQGGGGFDGTIPSAITTDTNGVVTAVNVAITDKAAIYAASNGGNRASNPAQAAPMVWADGTADGQLSATDFAYQSLGTTVVFAKSIAKAFYASAPKYTYFNGCSEGGREAYMVAQRWPDQYDGIVQGCETMDMTSLVSGLLSVSSKALTPAAISPPQFAASYAIVLDQCDAGDGTADGYLANPSGCAVSPAILECGQAQANTDPSLCLSSAQVSTLSGMLDDVVLADGNIAYSKYAWSDFSPWAPAYGGLAGGFALLATGDPSWMSPVKQATFHLDTDYYFLGDALLRKGIDHDKAAIAAYVASGKKLLSWHDAGDSLVSAADHARNHAIMTQMASATGLADPRTNTRLFIVPASSHGLGADFNQVDWLSAIIDWTENAKAPTQLTYAFAAGSTARTLPVCEFPAYPRYSGAGDVNAAASFTCTAQ